ncbi:MAG: class I SAM-dependent methyltransferase [Candidatus Omnitrophota bacterium]|nr:class I SAM-dependent methyltransferase [Candidatus Omnitrophota bacterium]
MDDKILFAEDFYKINEEGSRRSAREIIPLVLKLIQPKSVIDVGCGIGAWLSVFKEYGIEDIVGIDGKWINKKMLRIPEDRFLSLDIRTPLILDRQFDLVVSLEVAEHLPSECAETFIDNLTRLGPVILFSAAIPLQTGMCHLNEQWPDYWARYFRERGYLAIDCIREKIWQNDKVEWWYIQNTLIFARDNYLNNHFLLREAFENTSVFQLSIVHPRQYLAPSSEFNALKTKLLSILNSKSYRLISYLDSNLQKLPVIHNMLDRILCLLFSLRSKFTKIVRK